jgi:Cu/Ag efflux protein CusF
MGREVRPNVRGRGGSRHHGCPLGGGFNAEGSMIDIQRLVRTGTRALAISALATATACSSGSGGNLGSILGSVLGGGAQQQGGSQVSGTIRGVDTRAGQIGIQQSNGQTVALVFDNQTKVVYQNQSYPVTSLENGDQVTARVQSTNNGGYYTDLVQVDQPVSNTSTGSGTASGNVQSVTGTVRQIDQANGWFTVNSGNSGTLTVSLPYNVSRSDQTRFQNLRTGDSVRLYGVFLNNSRVELRQFY